MTKNNPHRLVYDILNIAKIYSYTAELKYDVKKLALKSNISQTSLYSWLNNKRNPNPYLTFRLAKALKTNRNNIIKQAIIKPKRSK